MTKKFLKQRFFKYKLIFVEVGPSPHAQAFYRNRGCGRGHGCGHGHGYGPWPRPLARNRQFLYGKLWEPIVPYRFPIIYYLLTICGHILALSWSMLAIYLAMYDDRLCVNVR